MRHGCTSLATFRPCRLGREDPPRTGRTAGPGAFSLAELMIALGILGIGIAMVAVLFPAALKQTEASYNDSIGTIIAQNGLAVARTMLKATDVTSDTLAPLWDDSTTPASNPPATLREYNDNPPATPDKGFIVLGRQIAGNEVQLVIVAYAKKNPTAKVTARKVTNVIIDNIDKSLVRSGGNFVKKSPLILTDGRYAVIEAVSPDVLLNTEGFSGITSDAFVIEESGGATVSPAMAVLTATVALPQ